jgi:hypothetical protein
VRTLNDGTIIVHDHAGCETRDILDAIRLQWSHLFPPRSAAERRRLAEMRCRTHRQRLERHRRLSAVCKLLRNVDALIRDAGAALKFCDVTGVDASRAWHTLEFTYTTRRLLEDEFARLMGRVWPSCWTNLREFGKSSCGNVAWREEV